MRYRFILTNLVAKEFKALYRSMALGFFWALLQPLVLVTVLSAVWVFFFHAAADFPAFVLVALIPYNFITYSVSGCTHAIVRNKSLVKKVAFPRQILPFSVVLTHVIHLLVQAPLVILVLLLFPPAADLLGGQLLWLPIILIVHLGLATGLGLLVSSLTVVYRDVQYLVDSALVVLFWVSPILYDAHKELVQSSDWLFIAYYLNPLAGILEGYRSVLYGGVAPDLLTFGMATVITLLIGILGVRTFWIHEKDFADLI